MCSKSTISLLLMTFVLVFVDFAIPAFGLCTAADSVSPETLVSTLRQRESSTRRVCFSWRGSLHQNTSSAYIFTDRPASLKILEDKYRYEKSIFRTAADKSVETAPHVAAFDGTTSYTLTGSGTGISAHGVIANADRFPPSDSGPLLAPSVLVRPFASGVLPSTTPRLDGQRLKINEHNCVSAVFSTANRVLSKRLWIEEKTLVPIRFDIERQGAIEVMVTLHFEGAPDLSSLSAWDYIMYANGNVMESGSARGVKTEVTCVLADKEFVIAYPRGARVVDKRSGVEIDLVANDDGVLVPRTQEERSVGIGIWGPSALLLAAVVVVVVFAFQWIRRRQYK